MRRHSKPKGNILKLGLVAAASLIWIIVRTGQKPSRIGYPCQKAALANIHVFLAVLFAPFVGFSSLRGRLPHIVNSRSFGAIALLSVLLMSFGSVQLSGNYSLQTSAARPVPLNLVSSVATGPGNSSDLFFVQNASGSAGSMNLAVYTLFQAMESQGLFLYKTAAQPDGLIARDAVVLIKVNSQWPERGGTSSDLLRSLIRGIVAHPEGFTGEIVVADNGQGQGSLDWYASNAFDIYQSIQTVVDAFSSPRVSTFLWDTIRRSRVNEYSEGDFRNGYVVNFTRNTATRLYVSYPKFRTTWGTYISLKDGIWSNLTSSYDSEKLKIISIPVLKSHMVYGVTGAVKHYMGVVSQAVAGGHNEIQYGAMGTEMAETRFPVLNIMDATWVNANPVEEGPHVGPSTPYAEASFTNVIGASRDPVALDYWASKHILIPAAIDSNHTACSSLDPDYEPITPGQTPYTMLESFHNYLERSMNELKRAGYQATMNEEEMSVYASWPVAPEMPGDLNRDGIVNGSDGLTLGIAFGSQPQDPSWNAAADQNSDGYVNAKDAVLLGGYFGRVYW